MTPRSAPTRAAGHLPAGLYCRISTDADGDRLGVARQEKLTRQLAQAKGWVVTEVYTDNDVSASTGRVRPAYERLKGDIAAGRIGAVAVFDLDRLHRRPAELEEFMTLADTHRIELATVGGDVNLSNPDDRFKARIMGAVARAEGEKSSKRLRAKHQELAEAGKPVGLGASVPFGYQRGGMELNEEEAALIRQAASDVLADTPVTSIARQWNRAGVRTPFPRPGSASQGWRPASVRALLMSPRPAGLRQHNGELHEAAWPPILDRVTHQRLVVALSPKPTRTPRRRSLLTGLVHCSLCGAVMVRDSRQRGSKVEKAAARERGERPRTVAVYSCAKGPGRPGCGGQSILAEVVETEVVAQMRLYVGRKVAKPVSKVMSAQKGNEAALVAAELAGLERRKVELAEQLGRTSDDLDAAELAVARRSNKTAIAEARAKLDKLTATSTVARFDTLAAFDSEWDQADTDRRWTLACGLVDQVTVSPAATGAQRDRARVQVTFKTV